MDGPQSINFRLIADEISVNPG